MSLINQLLQDLDKRRTRPSEAAQLPDGIRATAVPVRKRIPRPAVWLLALLGCAVVAAGYLWLWQSHSKGVSDTDGLLAAVRNEPTIPDNNPVLPAMSQAQVEASLMAPVFQLSSKLASPPEISHAALRVDSSDVAPRKKSKASKTRNRAAPPRDRSGSKRTAATASPSKTGPRSKTDDSKSDQTLVTARAVTTSSPKQEPPNKAEPAKEDQALVTANTAKESSPELKSRTEPDRAKKEQALVVAKAAATPADNAMPKSPSPRIVKAKKRPVDLRTEELEEVEISADAPASPIARKTRELTTYERAEIAFRKGVANLRQGRLTDAEAFFRLANEVDRSHIAARQALIGILIEEGRNADAEQVLIESLDINPRQPREAMVLARLQVERADLEAAIRTLESVSAYAGSDAGYYSFLAAVFQRASRHEDAVKQYRNALALMPRNAIWLMGMGISFRALGDSERAMDAFKRAATTGTLSAELQAYVVRQYTELHVAAR